ncbi:MULTISPECIES: FAD-binding oxidoreductase [unclassified Brevibacterium]|uniref:FAD-binding oxidoreductase n=1 Tax=unclassified Brevibacterium TaxID=2614124 RepID=UPI001D014462|nr:MULTISPECIES: FAD-binding oxidoreductase [unclassified Brevibacterium]
MTAQETMTTPDSTTISALREALSNQIDPMRVVTEEDQITAAAAIWNGAVDHRPALVVQCETSAEVQHAVRTAREFTLPLSVRGGGHDWAGRAIRPDGLVIDLSTMQEVSVHEGVATVAGGATSENVAVAADRFGFAAATGTVGSVGMTGLTLAGGYGPFCGSLGLATDNLLSAEVVLADGRLVRADQDSNPDLLWALRGGGGNFGVVTSIEVALHSLTEVLVGSFLFASEHAKQVLAGYGDLVSQAPDELTAVLSIVPSDDGTPVISVSATWSGPLADGYAFIEEFSGLATPLTVDISVMTPLAKLRQLDGVLPDGAHYAIGTRNIEALTPTVAPALLESYGARESSGSFLNVHHFHGRASDRRVEDTAFGRREDHLMIELIEAGETVSDWTKTAVSILASHALPGGYPNLLGPDEEEQTAVAYGPNTSRLLDIKERFDPHGVFHATALPDRRRL